MKHWAICNELRNELKIVVALDEAIEHPDWRATGRSSNGFRHNVRLT